MSAGATSGARSVPDVCCPPDETATERIANVITHGLGVVLAAAAWVAMFRVASRSGDLWRPLAASLFGASLVAVYLGSTLYHAVRTERLRAALRRIDKVAVYLAIAGTYTPVFGIAVGGRAGSSLVAVIWLMAAAGIGLQIARPGRFERLSNVLYLGMGWIGVLMWTPFFPGISDACLHWLLAGGLLYTAGFIFFYWHRLPYHHTVWHLFVLGGSACHVIAILFFVLP